MSRPAGLDEGDDEVFMRAALDISSEARRRSSPNPWVGCALVDGSGELVSVGATEPPGGRHAEVVALDLAGKRARGATLYVTLEPCAHEGRTAACAERIVAAGVGRVVLGTLDPDERVRGRGVARLSGAGIEVRSGVLRGEVEEYLRPYLTHRRSGRPFVVLKLAATLDGRIAAPDGTSRWITGRSARRDAHELRADSDAVMVGAGTVRRDDPELTVRLGANDAPAERQPLRVVLGRAGKRARVQPALELSGDPRGVLDDLGRRGVLQLLVEGGAEVAFELHRLGLVDRYVVYVAPVVLGGDDGVPLLSGPGAATMAGALRGRFASVRALGADVRLDFVPERAGGARTAPE